jgi:hypothetical protein
MEQYRHIVFVVGCVESCNVDERVTHAVSEIPCVQSRPSVVCQPYRLAVIVCILNILRLLIAGC